MKRKQLKQPIFFIILVLGVLSAAAQNVNSGFIYGSTLQSSNEGFTISPITDNQSGLKLDKNGNVGIATSDTKGYRLAVNGNALFTKIKVLSYISWPDYVFSATYKLPSWQEVEKYIKQYNHLPDVPSANDVAKNGIDVAENQAVLLQKIEELTLYMIQMQKDIAALKQKLSKK